MRVKNVFPLLLNGASPKIPSDCIDVSASMWSTWIKNCEVNFKSPKRTVSRKEPPEAEVPSRYAKRSLSPNCCAVHDADTSNNVAFSKQLVQLLAATHRSGLPVSGSTSSTWPPYWDSTGTRSDVRLAGSARGGPDAASSPSRPGPWHGSPISTRMTYWTLSKLNRSTGCEGACSRRNLGCGESDSSVSLGCSCATRGSRRSAARAALRRGAWCRSKVTRRFPGSPKALAAKAKPSTDRQDMLPPMARRLGWGYSRAGAA
mmetsp:Transcript_58600/g.163387  ORF Transcript_58600/g.163387 Transcript_58600/m.163387 type:complete len:260 (+) Transcript_58600:965-1744(+)